MEPEGSLSYSQVPATCPYPQPTLSSPHNPLQLPEDNLNINRENRAIKSSLNRIIFSYYNTTACTVLYCT
jgi:hypothetical protein